MLKSQEIHLERLGRVVGCNHTDEPQPDSGYDEENAPGGCNTDLFHSRFSINILVVVFEQISIENFLASLTVTECSAIGLIPVEQKRGLG